VRVEGLWGVGGLYNTPHNNMVLINDIVVGQIRLGASGPWTSGGCQLPAGRHSVLVVSRGPGDRDDFVLERISVVTADPVHVESGGPSRIWSEAARPTASSALGATQADIDAWIRNTSGRWDEMLRERRSREQRQMLIASLGGGSMPETPVAEPPSTYAFDPRMSFAVSRPPEFQENPSAVAIRSARIESESPLHAGGTAPTVLLDCDVDNAFVVRASRPALHWRWVPSGASGSPVGGGPISLGSIDRTDPRFRFSLPLAPPASGAWTLELTLTLGEFGARTQLRVDAES
jgi:hypothetical protein